MSGKITSIYSAGVGTSNLPVTVNGNSYMTLNSDNSNTAYTQIWAGVQYGNIATKVGNSVYNNLMGQGTLTSSSNTFTGGNAHGNVGNNGSSAGTNQTIFNNVDISSFVSTSSYQLYFAGGNASGTVQAIGKNTGFVYGDITNYVRAGFSDKGAYFGNVFGANGFGMAPNSGMKSSKAGSPGYESGALADEDAKKLSTSGHYENTYTCMKSGNVMSANSLDAYDLAGSCTRYDNGNATLEAGTTPRASIGANSELAPTPPAGVGAIGGQELFMEI